MMFLEQQKYKTYYEQINLTKGKHLKQFVSNYLSKQKKAN